MMQIAIEVKTQCFQKTKMKKQLPGRAESRAEAEQSTVNSVSSAHRCKLEVLTDSYQKRLTFSYQWYA